MRHLNIKIKRLGIERDERYASTEEIQRGRSGGANDFIGESTENEIANPCAVLWEVISRQKIAITKGVTRDSNTKRKQRQQSKRLKDELCIKCSSISIRRSVDPNRKSMNEP